MLSRVHFDDFEGYRRDMIRYLQEPNNNYIQYDD